MKPVMYIVANQGLRMSPGKLAAQVAHAAVEAYRVSKQDLLDAWYVGGHYTKIVLGAEDEEQLSAIEWYIHDRGFETVTIVDEGRTEIRPFSLTAIGVEIVDKDDPHVAATFGEFKLYRELPTPLDLRAAYNAVGAHGHLNWRGREYRKDGLPVKLRNEELQRGTYPIG